MGKGSIYRVYNGKRYRAESWHATKREALARAKVLRGRGYKARVVKDDKGRWYVWYF